MPKAKKSASVALASKTTIPPKKGAPPATFPIGVSPQDGVLAPPPLVDRYPLVVGQSLTVSYLSSVFRLATTGYRQQIVDVLRELIENDPHLQSVVTKRITAVATGRFEINPFELDEQHEDFAVAQEVCDLVKREIERIPNLVQTLQTLLWAIFYGVSCAEIIWSRDSDGWHVERLEFVHTRRIAWPDTQSWSAYIWDQGQVYGWKSPWGTSATNSGVFGLRLEDYPGKFVLFTPQLSADYPTREGLGRHTAVWAIFKRIGTRGAVSYLERFAKGFMDIAYATSDDGNPREAQPEDKDLASQIGAALGPGSGSYAVHPDSIQIAPKSFDGGTGVKLAWDHWIGLCDAQMSKVVLGGTLGTEVGHGGGNRALGEVQERSETDLEQYDAAALCECLRQQLFTWIVRLNKPEALHLVPKASILISTEPDPKSLVELAEKMTNLGAPVDLDSLSKQTLPLVPNTNVDKDGKPIPRRSFKSDVVNPMAVDPSLESPEAKKERLDAAAAVAAATAPKPSGDEPSDDEPKNEGEPPPDDDEEEKDLRLADLHRRGLRLLKTAAVAQQVYDQLREDYPSRALAWVLAGHWHGPVEVPLHQIDFKDRAQWRASKDDLSGYIERQAKPNRKPVILVKTPGNDKLVIVDGHHRTLACEAMGRPVVAFIAEMHVDNGPWLTLHTEQQKGSSKTSYAETNSSYFVNEAAE